MRLAVDTGGTFTDLVVESEDGSLRLFKAATVPHQPVRGIEACLELAATEIGTDRAGLLEMSDMFIHATTRGINAILTGTTARTGFVTTAGHRDILLYREGGRTQPFDCTREYPPPYIPRQLTYELDERIGSAGEVIRPLEEADLLELIGRLRDDRIEAVGVCLLWSILNPAHELRVDAQLRECLPDVAVTLSHRLNPTIREYRRASSACIDASLKPLMSSYFSDLDHGLRSSGFRGRLLIVSSSGGLLDVTDARSAPIHTLGSGPAMAPVAGRHYALREGVPSDALIVTDTGGTSFEVSLVENGSIPWTREAWLREQYSGDITGFPSVDVKSIGAGGGSIAWVDDGGLLRVGPQSAGSDPGPACYPGGGNQPTLTDACIVLGLLDPNLFLGGTILLNAAAAHAAIERDVAKPLGIETVAAAAAVLRVATEQMVRAIEETTLYRGIDPGAAAIIGGGGAAGFTISAIARRLGCRLALVPSIGPGLSAAGALLSDLVADYTVAAPTITTRFDFQAVEHALSDVTERARRFAGETVQEQEAASYELFAEARYPAQAWEIEVPLPRPSFDSEVDVEDLRSAFHATHRRLFGVDDPDSPVEIMSWRARVTCQVGSHSSGQPAARVAERVTATSRRMYLDPSGWYETPTYDIARLASGQVVEGPALVDTPHTTVLVEQGATIRLTEAQSLLIDPIGAQAALKEGA